MEALVILLARVPAEDGARGVSAQFLTIGQLHQGLYSYLLQVTSFTG